MNIVSLFELLRVEPNQIHKHKIRIGPEHDGGFVLIDNLKHINKLYSFYDTLPYTLGFENDFVSYTSSTVVHLFANQSHLIKALSENNDYFVNSNMILKVDMNDSGHLLINNTPDEVLNQFEQIVLILYGLGNVTHLTNVIQTMTKLTNLFYVVHIHANNSYPVTYNQYFSIPETIEVTLIRKNSYTLYSNPMISILPLFPSNFDSPNNPLQQDIYLQSYPFKNYYFSLSTIPSRMGNLKNVIDSLQNQVIKPKKIFIHIPRVYKRFPEVKFVIPDFSKLYNNVEVIRCTDYGSATKFLPMLFIDEVKNDDNIIIVDDDHTYDPLLSLKLIDLMNRHPNSASCMFGVTNALYFKDRSWNTTMNTQQLLPSGFRGHKEGYIDVFEGFGGVCLQKRFFNFDVLHFPIPDIYAHDDIWFSAHVIKNGFKIVVCGETVTNIPFQDKVDALCLDKQTFAKSANLMRYLQEVYKIYC